MLFACYIKILLKFCMPYLYADDIGADIVHMALWCSVMPLPLVSPLVLFRDLIIVCSITKSEPKPAQYWLVRLMT